MWRNNSLLDREKKNTAYRGTATKITAFVLPYFVGEYETGGTMMQKHLNIKVHYDTLSALAIRPPLLNYFFPSGRVHSLWQDHT